MMGRPRRLVAAGHGGERGLVASLVFKTSGTGDPRPVGSIPATSARSEAKLRRARPPRAGARATNEQEAKRSSAGRSPHEPERERPMNRKRSEAPPGAAP